MKKQIKVLVAPNSFKECADSVELAALLKASFNLYIPERTKAKVDFDYKPITDGGDGFFEVCKNYFGLETLHFEVPNAYNGEKFFFPAGYNPETKTLFIESAEVLGLKTIPEDFRNPMELTSKGMGELLLQLINGVETGFLEVKKLIVGIGGTGTNDLGMGMMEVFGMEFYDKKDNRLEILPMNFRFLEKIVVPEVNLPFEVEIICDVENPLLGSQGACKVFAAQKGASENEIDEMEKGFANLLKQMELTKAEIDSLHGAGGGLAAAFKLFFNANEKFAIQFLHEDMKITNSVEYDMVITGEGKYDQQSYMNKGAMIIANDFAEKEIPIYFICGETEGILPEDENIHMIELAEYFDSIEESLEQIDKGIDLACQLISKRIVQLVKEKGAK